MNSIRNILNNLDLLEQNFIFEARGHLDHPEDLVMLDGISGAKRALDSILSTISNPKTISIKWDGYPALIFGRGPNNKFSIMDKHMFNRKDGVGKKIYSPKEFIAYDKARGVDRAELHNLIANIWPGLQKASQGTEGYYWGDLLFGQPLRSSEGMYKFKANPNGITYTIDAKSPVGELLKNKVAGIAVHQYLPATALTTDDSESLNGGIGQLRNNSNVAIVPSAMPIVPNLKVDNQLVNDVKNAITEYSNDINQLMNAPQAKSAFTNLFTTYINKKIVGGNLQNLSKDFMDYVEKRPMTASMKQKLANHFNNNKQGIIGLFTLWTALYNLKMQIIEQIAAAAEVGPVKGYLQTGEQSQEGFVSQGLKFVDRMGFSRQNLSGQR